jgi:hypothetical protein
MNQLFTINSSNYKPISFRERYFYDYYDIVHSFLRSKLSAEEIERLLKPMLATEGNIHWYGVQEGEFTRITEADPDISNAVKAEFNSFIAKAQELGNVLKSKRDSDNLEWGNLITELFRHERIILINNRHGEWAMLWGWDFMSNNENRLPTLEPSRKPKQIIEEQEKEELIKEETNPSSSTNHNGANIPPIMHDPELMDDDESIIEEVEAEPTGKETIVYRERMGCLGRIRHWLRWISYRFWGLFWLLIYTLFIIWLCRYCDRPNCDAYCEKLKKTKKELMDLERRVRERCDTTYVKPN